MSSRDNEDQVGKPCVWCGGKGKTGTATASPRTCPVCEGTRVMDRAAVATVETLNKVLSRSWDGK